MNPVALTIIGLLLLVVILQAAWIARSLLRDWQDLKRRLEALEARPEKSRLTHTDLANAENASAALSKIKRELQTYIDYLDNANFWVGKIRNQVEDED